MGIFRKKSKIFLDYAQFYAESLDTMDITYNTLLNNKALNLAISDNNSNYLINSNNSVRILFNQKGIRVHLTGSFFENDDLVDNVAQVHKYIKLIQIHKLFKPFLVSRLDLAKNHYGQTMKNHFVVNEHKSVMTEIKNDGQLNTIYLGKRGTKTILYRCYDKRPHKEGHSSAIKRFGTIEFCRSEYQLDRDVVRKYGIDTSIDIKVKDIERIWKWISSKKRVEFVNPAFIPKKKVEKCYIAKPQQKDLKKLHLMIKGIYSKNFNETDALESIEKIKKEVYGLRKEMEKDI